MVMPAVVRIVGAGTLAVALAACSSNDPAPTQTKEFFSVKEYGPASPKMVSQGTPVPKGGGRYQVGKPYTIAGKTYVPRDNPSYSATGNASWYGAAFHGRKTANGEIYDMHDLTAAHPTLPLPSYVRVTNLENGRSVVVRVNDRGPFAHNRLIDVSKTVAGLLGFEKQGVAKVKVDYVGRADLDGRDRAKLLASFNDPAKPQRRRLFASAKPLPVAQPQPVLKTAYQNDHTLQPSYALRGPADPLGSLITNVDGVSSFAPIRSQGAALAALEDFARSPGVVVQVGSFIDPANAQRISGAFTGYGQVTVLQQVVPDRPTVQIVRVAVTSGEEATRVIHAATQAGLQGAFIVSQ